MLRACVLHRDTRKRNRLAAAKARDEALRAYYRVDSLYAAANSWTGHPRRPAGRTATSRGPAPPGRRAASRRWTSRGARPRAHRPAAAVAAFDSSTDAGSTTVRNRHRCHTSATFTATYISPSALPRAQTRGCTGARQRQLSRSLKEPQLSAGAALTDSAAARLRQRHGPDHERIEAPNGHPDFPLGGRRCAPRSPA